MNEKDEALRLAEELYAFHAAKKEMPTVGGQMLGLERYRIVASGEAFSQMLDAAAELRRLHAENERLREEVRNWKKSFVGYVYVKNEDYAELISKRDALKTENERLREALEKVADASMSMHLNAAHMATSLQGIAKAALRREDEK